MRPPLVTVLMPAYNAERFIGSAIRSVLSQTFSDFELLIIDDGSVDGTKGIITAFADQRIRLLNNSGNIGLIPTLNLGMQEAQGKYIARLDADDLCFPTRLAEQVEVLEKDIDVGLASSWTEVIDEDDRTKGFGRWVLSPEAIYYVLHFRQCLTHSSVMFRKALVSELGGYSAKAVHAEDFDLWHRLSKVNKIVQLPKVLVKWRTHSRSISGTEVDDMESNALQLAGKYLRELTGMEYGPDMVKALVDCRSVRNLPPQLLSDFPTRLTEVQARIASAAPDVYDKARLRSYSEIETAKYAHVCRHLGMPFDFPAPTRVRCLGFMYYLISYYRLPLTCRFIPQSHF